MNTAAAQPTASHTYDLVHRRKGVVVVLRHRDRGVTLGPDAISWRDDGTPRSGRYADILEIRLSTGHIPKSGTFGSCEIIFEAGVLIVMSVDTWGATDDARNTVYRDFVRDVHARLGPADRERIAFNGGITPGRLMFGWIAFWLATTFFIALPIVLLMVTRDLQALFIAGSGLIFIYPVYNFLRRNAPQTYRPDAIRPELLP